MKIDILDEMQYLVKKYEGVKNKGYAVAGMVSETVITHDSGDTLKIERVGNLVGISENDVLLTTYVDFEDLEK